jgi:hypothetical protein
MGHTLNVQQPLPQFDYRMALLDAARRELTRLQEVQDQDRRRELTDAALEALKYARLRTPA